jgi:DnaJ-class molecular chaperone
MSKRKEPWIPPHYGKKRCQQCKGTGKVIVPAINYGYYWTCKTVMCDDCGGKGYK